MSKKLIHQVNKYDMNNAPTYIQKNLFKLVLNKTTLLVAALMLSCAGAYSKEAAITEKPEKKSVEEMLDYSKTLIRRPYRSGATGPYAFDCSGFTYHCFKKLGITLKRTSEDQSKQGKRVRRKRLRPGDLVFFNGSKIGKDIGHVGIVVSAKKGVFTFIHASSSVGITTTSSSLKYYEDRYKKARRITSDKSIKRALKEYANAEKDAAKKEKELAKQAEKEQKEALKRQKEAEKEAEKARKEAEKEAKKKKEEQTNNTAKTDEKVNESKNEQTKPAENQTNEQSNNGIKTITGPYHTVVSGDTLYNISRRAGCSVSDLQKWNNLDGNSISVGQTIRVRKP